MTKSRGHGGANLGTFGGVFTPSVLTILGLILFLRLGYVVGLAGLGGALLMLAIATAISLSTSVSLSAIATNRKVRGGGDYYLISRSLGIAHGGALGLVLFVAQAVSVAFYCVGFAEGVVGMLPDTFAGAGRVIATVAAVGIFGLAYLGADVATRFQYVIMGVLGAGLVSIAIGAIGASDPQVVAQNWNAPEGGPGFWVLFAIFFPAVTGFTQGVSMSGDLAKPERSLPLGTFAAVGVSTVVYAGIMIAVAGALPAAELAADYLAMKRIAAISWLVTAGILAATLSSALASFLGAPRILQALAADGVFRRLKFFAHGAGPSGNPRRAVALTAAIAFVVIAAGDLNAIARIVSMFFLISYGLLNYATYVEATAASPSFRPRFRFFHARASLMGVVLCAGVMLAIDPVASVVATAVLAAVHEYVRRSAVPAGWRDSQRAYRFRRVKDGLRELSQEPENPVDWQPHILAFTEGAVRRERVLGFASWIAGGSGVITAVRLMEGDATSELVRAERDEISSRLQSEIAEKKLDAYELVVAAPDLRTAFSTLVQAWGLGPIRSNTILANLPDGDAEGGDARWFARNLAHAARLDQNVVLLDTDETAWVRLSELPSDKRRIDVWWFQDESSKLMLLLAYLMTRTEDWDEASLRVLVPATAEDVHKVEANLRVRLEEARIDASVEGVIDAENDALVGRSRDAGIVFLPLRIAGMRLASPFGDDLESTLRRLPLVALVAAAHDVPLTEVETGPEPPAAVEPIAEGGPPEEGGSP